ncbi:hypothetical protein POM88_050096 [Heracleum sosnowskyi]|uniref:Uncharacterized protein n=1 Tax=Heracleum sosnowskyi TaxID=360622 RepID=A0AAD8GWV8_9APIA|nr:hypothetical protein POM88_050096 [Heracleum sosnowskyi]
MIPSVTIIHISSYELADQICLSKHRLQAQSAMAEASYGSVAVKYGGPIDVARHVFETAGVRGLFRGSRHVFETAGARGLFRGLVLTMAREIPGNATMIGIYEGLKQYLAGGLDTSKLGRG